MPEWYETCAFCERPIDFSGATLGFISIFLAEQVLRPLAAGLGLTSTFKPNRLIDVLNATPEELAEIPPSTSLGVSHFRAPIKRDEA